MELIPGLTNDLARECLIRLPFEAFGHILPVCKAWNSEIRSLDFHRHRTISGYTRPCFVLSQMSPDRFQTTTSATYEVTLMETVPGFIGGLPPGPDLPFTTPRIYCRVAIVGTKLVVFITGVIDDKATNIAVHVFEFLTFQWRIGAVMPGPGRVYFGLASDPYRGKVLVAGGFNETTRAMGSALLYDVESDTWQAVGDMERGRFLCDLVFLAGRLHVVSGSDQSQETCLAAESLDIDTWRWGPHTGGGGFVEAHLGLQRVMDNGEGDVYRFSAVGQNLNVEVRRGGKWHTVVDFPVEFNLVGKLIGVVMWRDKLMMIRAFAKSTSCWGNILDLKTCKWTQMRLPKRFNIYTPIYGCGIDL